MWIGNPTAQRRPPVTPMATRRVRCRRGLAVLIGAIMRGQDLPREIDEVESQLRARHGHAEVYQAIKQATEVARRGPGPEHIESIGGGGVAEEALAIAIYSSLVPHEPGQLLDALSLEVTHVGDSDSTGGICGDILGALHGETALPPELAFEVEGRDTILPLADDDFIYEFAGERLHGESGLSATRAGDRREVRQVIGTTSEIQLACSSQGVGSLVRSLRTFASVGARRWEGSDWARFHSQGPATPLPRPQFAWNRSLQVRGRFRLLSADDRKGSRSRSG